MIPFEPFTLDFKPEYDAFLMNEDNRGCEYSFANLYLWGVQQHGSAAGCVVFFSHFFGRSVYPWPIGPGDKRAALEAVLSDARQRGIPARIVSMSQADCQELEGWFPGQFLIQSDRDSFDYVYDIHALADLKGRAYQKKRNHFNRFRSLHPEYTVLPLTRELFPQAKDLAQSWYESRAQSSPQGGYRLEHRAMDRAFRDYEALGLEGLALMEDGQMLALTMGSPLSRDTFDIHFEKAGEDVDGAYAAINCEFARYLRSRHPELRFLNREDDLGIEGLRNAKLSYNPHHMQEKYWAYLREELL